MSEEMAGCDGHVDAFRLASALFKNVRPGFSTVLLKSLWKTSPKVKVRLKAGTGFNSLH
jgi:hypothetical protein